MPADIPQHQVGRVGKNVTSYLHLRAQPTTRSAIKAKLFPDTTFVVEDKEGNWYCVYVPSTGMMGYVYSEYVELLDPPFVVPSPIDESPIDESPQPPTVRSEQWKWWVGGGILAAIAVAVYSCGGPVR